MSKTYYLGPIHLKETLINSLYKESLCLFDVEYIGIETLISEMFTIPSISEVRETLSKLSLNIYKEALIDDGFIQELISIKTDLVKYNTKATELRIDSELLNILNNTNVELNYNLSDDYSNYYILNVGYDLFELELIKKLKERGAKDFCFKKNDNKSYIINCLNESKEIEAVAQHILKNDVSLNDCGLIINSSTNKELVRSILDLYHIPYQFEGGDAICATSKFIAIVDYYLNQSVEAYINLINANIFVTANYEINNYLAQRISSFSEIHSEFNKFTNDIKLFKLEEEEANKIHQQYLALIKELETCDSLTAAFDVAYRIIPEEKIAVLLSTYYKDEINIENYPQIRNRILSLKKDTKYKESLTISSLQKGIYDKEALYVLDVTSTAYPGFKGLNGILHENEISNTSYPSIVLRKQNVLDKLEYLKYSKNTYFIFPLVQYNGKENKISSYVQGEILDFEVLKNETHYSNDHEVNDETVKEILFKNNKITSSISALEKYMSCPYSYFISYVLGIKEQDTLDLAANTIGTIFHKLLETLIKEKGEFYYTYSQEEIENYIKDDFDSLMMRYPHKQKLIEISKRSLIDACMLLKEFLNKMENETVFKPSGQLCEVKFEDELVSKIEDFELRLNGYIDRIDLGPGYFRILDYKTQGKQLTDSETSKGLKLQLYTYALVYKRSSGKSPEGVYYLRLNPSNMKDPAYTYKITGGFEESESTAYDNFIKGMRMDGRNFIKDEDLYSSDSCKQGRKVIPFNIIEEGLAKIYEYILNKILLNEFKPEPCDKACEYCPYKSICRVKGIIYDIEPIYEFERNAKESS